MTQKAKTSDKRISLEDVGNFKLPQNIESEKMILGCLMMDSKVFGIVNSYITSEDCFYNEAHRNIYEILQVMHSRNEAIDIVSLAEEMNRHNYLEGSGGAVYLSEILDYPTTSANIETHCRIVKELYFKRLMIKWSSERLASLYEPQSDIFDEITKAEKEFQRIRNESVVNEKKTIVTICREATYRLDKAEEMKKAGTKLIGISSGFREVDAILGGFQPKYYVIGARPSKGKSALIASIVYNQINFTKPIRCGILSGEMTDVDLLMRIAMIETQFNPYWLYELSYTDSAMRRLRNRIKDLEKSSLIINAPPTVRQEDLRTMIKAMVLDEGAEVIYFDHVQKTRLRNNNGKKNDGFTEVSNELASLSLELKIPIVANAQLSRGAEARPLKTPSMADLKESGSFEEDADVVMLIHRPEHDGYPQFADGTFTTNRANILIPKHRNGATGIAKIGFIPKYSWFVDAEKVDIILDVNNSHNTEEIGFDSGDDGDEPF